MDWEKESAERLAEASELRGNLRKLGPRLVELLARTRVKRRDLHEIDKRRRELSSDLWMRWVRTEAAQEPDPRTGRSNEEWRRHLWEETRGKSGQENTELGDLDPAAEQSKQELAELDAEISECRMQIGIATEQISMLAAELRCLAALGGQDG